MSDAHNFKGVVQGGPWDGRRITNNASKGFVLVDLNNKTVWVHDYDDRFFGSDTFNAREPEELDHAKLEKAQEDGGRSVIVFEGASDG